MLARRRRSLVGFESLEFRRLLSQLVVNDTPGVDTITLGVTAAGGVSVNVNGSQTDYGPGQWDSVLVSSTEGPDTVNVKGTVVPSVVHYRGYATINVGDASGVQNIKASLNMNGASGGPVVPGFAQIAVNDTGDTVARTVVMKTVGDKESIVGLAPAEISIGVEVSPVGPQPVTDSGDTLALTTGSGADGVVVQGLRYGLSTTFFNVQGNDSINVGDGSLAGIGSSVIVWGRPLPTGLLPGNIAVRLDDSKGTAATAFELSVIRPPGPGPIQIIDFAAAGSEKQELSYRVQEVATATIDGGSGGNSFVLHEIESRLEGPGTVVTLNTGGGNDSVVVDESQGGTSLVVNGQAGDDLLKAGPIGPFGGVNGSLEFHGGLGSNTLVVNGPKANPFDIPTVAVVLTMGKVSHQWVEWTYSDVSKLQIQNGWFVVNEFLGPIELVVTSEASGISFESSTMVEINASQKLMSLAIASGPVVLSAGGGKEIQTGVLNISGDGTLDLTNNSLSVNYNVTDPFPSIRKWVVGKTIFSSLADASHNLGYADRPGGIDFAPFGTVLVKYTLYGDANLDRRVDFADLVALAQNYNQRAGVANWDQGDFNYDSLVDFKDLTLLAQNYNKSMAAVAAAAPVTRAGVFSPAPAVRRKPQGRPR
jgi:hypothetical protein